MSWPPWLVALLGLPLWFGPPLLFIIVTVRRRTTRIVAGITLVVALGFLYAALCQLLPVTGTPARIEAVVLWIPTTLAVAGAGALTERLFNRRQEAEGASPPARRRPRPALAATLVVVTICGNCLIIPQADRLDFFLGGPRPALVLPLPDNLSLLSADRNCGSGQCFNVYLIGSPDEVSTSDVIERLWAHLTGKGWQRRGEDTGCLQTGWFLHPEFCLYVLLERAGPTPTLKVVVAGVPWTAAPRHEHPGYVVDG